MTAALRGVDGIEAESADDAFEAIRMLTRKAYVAVAVDVEGMETESLRFLSAAREELPTALLIAVASPSAQAQGLRALRLGADMILRKPFYPDELRLLILRLAGGRARGGAGHDQAEARLSSFGRVARGLAHQINNPLTAISGWLQVLAEDPRSPASSRGTLDIIRDEAGKIRAVVDRLLLLAGQKIVAPEPVDLNAVVCQAVSETERRLPNGGPRIAMRLEPNTPAVLGDPGQLRQAVTGILGRLTAPCPKGSVMRVETTHAAGRVTLVFRAPPGTAPRLQEGTLFAPFADEDEDPAAFDLALCRRVIENHGGSVDVSAEGQPSVRLALPTGGPETET